VNVGMMSYFYRYILQQNKRRFNYYKPIGAPIHIEEGYDSLKDYELGIKHFKD
jgi:hypothetical protein